MDDTNFYGIDIVAAYDLELEKLYEIIKTNTKYLDEITKSDIKDIKITYHKDIIVLLKNDTVYLNGKELYKNIKTLIFMSGVNIFGISNDNEIISIVGSDNNTRFMTNNNYKYKKIISTPLLLVALNNEKEVRIYGCMLDFAINYKNFYNVDDIAYIEDEDDIVVLKDNKLISLLHNTDYYDVEIVLNGTGKDYQIF